VVISKENPDELIAAKKSSPLVIGIGKDEYFLASDATPIVEYTKNVVYLEDGEIARLSLKEGLKLKTIKNQAVTPYIQELQMQLEALEKGGFDHFMFNKRLYER
jgi:glucosamine--fructose-6-phosphate aminotransferase (isomerizing)